MPKTQQEQRGYAKVHILCAEMNAIWRPTPNVDLGIDGQIEFLEAGGIVSTGKLIAVQVKSGPSYFKTENNGYVKYYPAPKHHRYWRQLRLPVLLVLHDPDRDLTIYTRVKPQLENSGPIVIPLINSLTEGSRDRLIAEHDADVVALEKTIRPDRVLESFKSLRLRVSDFGLSPGSNSTSITGIHFLLSTANPEHRYFELRGIRLDNGFSAAGGEHLRYYSNFREFLMRCVEKCWNYNLIEPFQEEFEFWWYDLSQLIDVVLPLTQDGLLVCEELLDEIDKYLEVPEHLKSQWHSPQELCQHIMLESESASERLDNSDRIGDYIL